MDKQCTCTFYKLKERGFRPVNHAFTCPMFKQEYSPVKEEWPSEIDFKRYNEMNEKRKSHSKEQAIRNKKIRDKG